MAAGRFRYYWDTAPLIAWLTDEHRPKAELAGIAAVIERVDRGQAVLMTSVLWRAEVIDLDLSPTVRHRLDAAFDSQNIVELAIDSRVMDLTGEIRAHQKKSTKKAALKNLRVPDAIHLASAILYEADEFHTFDGSRPGRNAGGLLSLNGNVAGHRLKICVPTADQYILDLTSPDAEDDETRST